MISIDPAEKLVEGVVYYKVTIDFEKENEAIKPGMTADVVIETAKKEDVLVVPRGALEDKNEKKIVKVLENGQVKEREVETGLEGDQLVEILSGLSEGDQVVVK